MTRISISKIPKHISRTSVEKMSNYYLHKFGSNLSPYTSLPTSAATFGVLAQLPAPTHPIPRKTEPLIFAGEKPVPPSEKPLTKWEEYAKIKGIKSRKKDRMEFDDRLGLNRPRWGFKSKTEGKQDV